MPIISSNPPEADGHQYPLLAVSLAISPRWDETAVGASAVLVLAPYRIAPDTGAVERLPEAQRTVPLGNVADAAADDPNVAALATEIRAAIQKFVASQGW